MRTHPSTLLLLSCLLPGVAPGCGKVGARPAAAGVHQQRLVVASSPRCSVEIRQISYDDPGSDDAEYVQLVVRGAAATPPAVDAGAASDPARAGGAGGGGGAAPELASCSTGAGGGLAGPDAGALASTETTLGDCGLESLDLLNGGVDGCPVYRSLDLTGTAVPQDGIVAICSEDSTLVSTARCDVTHAGTRKLPNGWLQNGPNDGMRFVGTDGQVTELGYEGTSVACFSGEPVMLADESGEGADGADDVNVACDARFELRSAATVSPVVVPPCDAAPGGALDDGGGAVGDGATAAADGGVTAVATAALASGTLDETITTESGATLSPAPDAGADDTAAATPSPPAIGCAVSSPAGGARTPEALLGVLAGALAVATRRRDRAHVEATRWAASGQPSPGQATAGLAFGSESDAS